MAVLQALDFEDLAAMGMGASYTFKVEAVDQGGVMPPGQTTVTVRITVRVPGQSVHHKLLLVFNFFYLSSLLLWICSSGTEYWVTISRLEFYRNRVYTVEKYGNRACFCSTRHKLSAFPLLDKSSLLTYLSLEYNSVTQALFVSHF